MADNIFDTLPKDFVNKETGEVKAEVKQELVAKKQTPEQYYLDKVVEYAKTSGEQLNQKTKDFAVDIITMTSKKLASDKTSWNELDIVGCGFPSQIKRWAKLGVGQNDNLYLDIRNNNKTGKKDIAIKPQYQTLEKLITLYYYKPVERFKTEIVCVGDVVIRDEDFETGLTKITGHKRNMDIDRNNLDNMVGAYKIMYFRETNGELKQLVVEIDRNRIDRAYNASPSKEKTVWKADSVKMVKKTVTWEMFNSENVRPFMQYPDDVVRYGDQTIITENEEMNWDNEKKYENVENANEEIRGNIAKGQAIDVPFEE